MPPSDRTYRTSAFSRERNRMHARKTRQRKKEHMQNLQNRADELKLEQIRLKQAISEKNTASILVGLFQDNSNNNTTSSTDDTIDPRVDALLKRSIEEIPDASKIPELPALILSSKEDVTADASNSNAGIDYKLLHKDRSTCSPSELDQIRRERNRMHAKRTRDRKRIFMEEMEVMICQLEEENCLLCNHLEKVSNSRGTVGFDKGGFGDVGSSTTAISRSNNGDSASSSSLMVSPEFGPVPPPSSAPSMEEYDYETNDDNNAHYPSWQYNNATASTTATAAMPPSQDTSRGDFLNQIESLLAAAGAFEKRSVGGEINAISCAESDVTASSTENNSVRDGSLCEEEEVERVCKKARVDHCDVPSSITTTTLL